MSTTTGERDQEANQSIVPLRNEALITLPRCARCNLSYVPTRSSSALRLTYCSFLCELGHLGFSMAGLEQMERKPRDAAQVVEPVPVEP